MDTPEGKVKKEIREYLDTLNCYHHWPVPVGYGASTVDCLMCYRGKFIALEVKRPGEDQPTPWQEKVLKRTQEAGGVGLVVNDVVQVKQLIQALNTVNLGPLELPYYMPDYR